MGARVAGAVNETMTRFGYPDTLIKGYSAWAVLLRPAQPTLGSMVLVCNEEATAFADISAAAAGGLHPAVQAIERTVKALWPCKRMNYLMLMMVDPHVHFHVIPRYDEDQQFDGQTFKDTGWPKQPNLGDAVTLEPERRDSLVAYLRDHWRD